MMSRDSCRSSLVGLIIAIGLGLLAAIACDLRAQRTYGILLDRSTDDAWFECDIAIIFANMVDRDSDHYRTRVHPLFSLLTYVPVSLLRRVLSLPPENAVRLFNDLVAGVWAATFFCLVKLMGCRFGDAILLTLVALISSASFFFLSVPETYGLSSLTILLALILVVLQPKQRLARGWYLLVSALTLSFTVTNWMFGIAVTYMAWGWRRTIRLSMIAFMIVTALWAVQNAMMPSASFFLRVGGLRRHMLAELSGGPFHITEAIIFHSMVMPELHTVPYEGRPALANLSVQKSTPGSGTRLGLIASFAWAAMLVIGVSSFSFSKQHDPLRAVLTITFFAQLVMHLIYGEETILYSLNFLVLLMGVVAFGTLGRMRPLMLGLAAVFVICAGLNNAIMFNQAIDFFVPVRP